jgi:hypothetical protein
MLPGIFRLKNPLAYTPSMASHEFLHYRICNPGIEIQHKHDFKKIAEMNGILHGQGLI